MAKSKRIRGEGTDREAGIRAFLSDLLSARLVEAVLAPREVPAGDNVVQTLVTTPQEMERVRALAPVMPVNSARIISALTKVSPSPRRMAVVMHPCELRALTELVKLKQASRENMVVIGIDCYGTYSVEDYAARAREGKAPPPSLTETPESGLRTVCRMCEYPSALNADIGIEFFGEETPGGFWIRALTEGGEEILGALGFGDEARSETRDHALTDLVSRRKAVRDQVFQETTAKAKGLDNLLAVLSACINCHNCRGACPLCYCKECFFDSSTFDWEADKYLEWAKRAGALHMPTDTLLFHLTRMVHMVHSCVGCGSCSEACPNNIPVADVFRLAGRDVQALFDYVPGRSAEEPIPVATFREEELQTIG